MEEPATPHISLFARMQNPIWQDQLRASVRQYLELGTGPGLVQEVDALLQRTEAALLDYLLAGLPPSAPASQHARHLLDMAQHQLLDYELQAQDMRLGLSTF